MQYTKFFLLAFTQGIILKAKIYFGYMLGKDLRIYAFLKNLLWKEIIYLKKKVKPAISLNVKY